MDKKHRIERGWTRISRISADFRSKKERISADWANTEASSAQVLGRFAKQDTEASSVQVLQKFAPFFVIIRGNLCYLWLINETHPKHSFLLLSRFPAEYEL